MAGRRCDREAVGRVAREGGDAVVIVVPADCRLCKKLLVRASRVPICEECLASFAAIAGDLCEIWVRCPRLRSGVPRRERREEATQTGNGRSARFAGRGGTPDRARSYATYGSELVRAIVMLKF